MLFKYPYQVYNEIMNLNENFLFLITNYDNGMCNTIIRMSDEVYYIYNEPIDKSEIKDYFFKGRFIRIYRFSSVMQFNLYNQIVHETDIQAINKFKVYSNNSCKVHWLVFGKRFDIQVEVNKDKVRGEFVVIVS